MRPAKKGSDMNSHGVVALTGASGFLVSELSKALSLKGWKVAFLDQNLDGVESLARSICERKGEAIAIKTDVCTKDSYHNALEVILKMWDHLDGAVFGAGPSTHIGNTSYRAHG
jgi:NADP-dependent 3-hydroxy acid dehydrogenase YdfG